MNTTLDVRRLRSKYLGGVGAIVFLCVVVVAVILWWMGGTLAAGVCGIVHAVLVMVWLLRIWSANYYEALVTQDVAQVSSEILGPEGPCLCSKMSRDHSIVVGDGGLIVALRLPADYSRDMCVVVQKADRLSGIIAIANVWIHAYVGGGINCADAVKCFSQTVDCSSDRVRPLVGKYSGIFRVALRGGSRTVAVGHYSRVEVYVADDGLALALRVCSRSRDRPVVSLHHDQASALRQLNLEFRTLAVSAVPRA